MKKIIFSIFVISFFTGLSFSQEAEQKKYLFTVDENNSEVTTEGTENTASETEPVLEVTENIENSEEAATVFEGDSETADDEFTANVINMVEVSKPSLTVSNIAEANIKEVEDSKKRLYEILSTYEKLIEDFNKKVDEETELECKSIYAEEYTSVELEADNNPSQDAIKRREERCNIVRDDARIKKEKYAAEQKALIEADEKKERNYLAASYKVMESGKYSISSYADNLNLSIGNFDGGKGAWIVTLTYNLCGKEVMNFETYLDFEDVTGQKFISADKMSTSQLKAFSAVVDSYDKLFKKCPEVFCARINYDIYRWKQNSEYRFVPTRCEVLNIARKNKVILRLGKIDIKPRVFIIDDGVEIRTKQEIDDDVLKFNKQLAKEAKENQTEADKLYQSYTENYQNDKSKSDKDPVIQKGRGAFVVSLSSMNLNEEMSDFGNNIAIDVLDLELCIPKWKYFFWGFDTGLYFPVGHGVFDVKFGLLCGLNCQITHFFRPYTKVNVDFDTRYQASIKAGAGLDFIIADTILINIGYSYNWDFDHNYKLNQDFDLTPIPEDQRDTVPLSMNQKFSIGVGLAW